MVAKISTDEHGQIVASVSTADLDEMLRKRQHDIYVTMGSLANLLHISEMLASALRHLLECEGNCRAELGKAPLHTFVTKICATMENMLLDKDDGIPPSDAEGDAGEDQVLYYVATPAEMLRLLTLGGYLHSLCVDIAHSTRDASAVEAAISASRLMDRYGDIVYQMIGRGAAGALPDGDAIQFCVYHNTVILKDAEKEPESPGDMARRKKKTAEDRLQKTISEVIGGLFPKPDDPNVN